jgi:hypothetical protein
MHDLPTWEIIVGGVVIGFTFVLLLCFLLVVLLSWWTGVSEPPNFVLFVARKIARYFRRPQFRRGLGAAADPVNSDPVTAPHAFAATNSDQMAG